MYYYSLCLCVFQFVLLIFGECVRYVCESECTRAVLLLRRTDSRALVPALPSFAEVRSLLASPRLSVPG